MRLDCLELFGSLGALIPRLECDKKERVVTGAHVAQQTETDDACRVLYAGRAHQDFLYISGSRSCTFQRSAVRELKIDEGVALIFVWKKTRRYSVGKKSARQAKAYE